MRKALLFVVVLALAVSVAGCASSSTTSTSQNSTSTSVASVTGPGDSTNPGATTGASDTTTSDESQAVTTEPPTTLTAETTTTSLPSSSATVTHEQNDSRFLYYGGWKTSSASGAAGGSYAVASSSGESLTIHFIGTHFAWIAKVGPTLGEAKVAIDGGKAVTVDLYSSGNEWQKRVWSTGILADTKHVVRIEWTGTKHKGATAAAIDVDAIEVTGTLD